MYILRIEHDVPSYDGWKQAFDSDPVGRAKSGVRRYQIYRPLEDPNHVMVDLIFETSGEAEDLLGRLRIVWGQLDGSIMSHPQACIVEAVESKEY